MAVHWTNRGTITCRRTAAESIDKLREMRVEQETPDELIEKLRFNLTHVAESEI
jgi:hypothetical protein